MSDIYLAVSETPTVVTLTSAVINSAVASSVTVMNTVTVALDANSLSALENVTVTVGAAITGTVTVSSLPAISGTVTASNLPLVSAIEANRVQAVPVYLSGFADGANIDDINRVLSIPSIPAGTNRIGVVTIGGGTVTIGAGTAQIGSVTVSSLPAISGTVSIGNLGDGITTFWADNAIADISDGVNLGIADYIDNYDNLLISGTVTANPSISSTAITSGSFASLTSATLVPGNVARKMATVYNLGAGQLFVNAGATATTLGGGFMVALSSGDYFECGFTTTTLSALFASAGTASWVSH